MDSGFPVCLLAEKTGAGPTVNAGFLMLLTQCDPNFVLLVNYNLAPHNSLGMIYGLMGCRISDYLFTDMGSLNMSTISQGQDFYCQMKRGCAFPGHRMVCHPKMNGKPCLKRDLGTIQG